MTTVKRMFIWAFAVVVCFIGLLFVYSYFYPVAENPSTQKEQGQTSLPADKLRPAPKDRSGESSKKAAAGTTSLKVPQNVEIPQLLAKRKEQIIRHEGYTVSYNSDYKIANWVAYELTSDEAKSKKAERSNKFVPDPQVKGATAENEDYTRTGFDRGHLAPAGDMKWSVRAMRESFYLSNICPQKPGLNRGIWKQLEEQSRLWALDNGAVWIVTGPVLSGELKRLGKNGVGVPVSFYKVICTVTDNKFDAIAFLLDNRDYDNVSLKSMVIPVDSVEKVTGIDFFPSIPDEQEKKMEASVDWNSWSFL